MISYCSAWVMDGANMNAPLLHVQSTFDQVISIEPSLHQLDMRGDATGFFNSGFLITSLHHLISWTTAIPPWHSRYVIPTVLRGRCDSIHNGAELTLVAPIAVELEINDRSSYDSDKQPR